MRLRFEAVLIVLLWLSVAVNALLLLRGAGW